MSSIVISGDTSGAITLAASAVSGTNTATLPAATGTVMVSGNMPAFSATASANQTLTTSTNTKVQFNTKIFDTANAFDNTTNYRFTPGVAGYYQVNASAQFQGSSLGGLLLYIYKNGSIYNLLAYGNNGIAVNPMLEGSILISLGITDYIEIYVAQSSGGNLTLYGTGAGGSNQFSASMVRAA